MSIDGSAEWVYTGLHENTTTHAHNKPIHILDYRNCFFWKVAGLLVMIGLRYRPATGVSSQPEVGAWRTGNRCLILSETPALNMRERWEIVCWGGGGAGGRCFEGHEFVEIFTELSHSPKYDLLILFIIMSSYLGPD